MTPGYAINPWVAAVESPPIPAARAWAASYGGERGPFLDLSQAAPGTPPPAPFLAQLAAAAGSADAARYGPILGDAVLREAHAGETSRIYGGVVTAANVAITAGCNQAFIVAMMALAKAGDAVILPAPWYFNHAMVLSMLGIEARVLPTHAEAGFLPDPDEAERLVDSRTRAIVLVSPNNPTGAVCPPETIERFARLARRHGIALILDETYRDFLPAGQARGHDLFSDPDWGRTLIQLYSFSKAYAIPGHRLGAMVASPAFITEAEKVLDCIQICPARPAQRVVAEAISGLADWREAQRRELATRAAACRVALAGASGWHIDSAGAYFAFVAHPFSGTPAVEVARRLAMEGGVLGLPGSFFGPGLEGHLRLAFANVDGADLAGLPARLAVLIAPRR